MPELTIHLSEEAHAALETSAASCGRSIDELVEESLAKSGLLRSRSRAVAASLREARAGSPLSDEEALAIAIAETRAVRKERVERRRRQGESA
ncbi:MAG TPA: hypothetical protein VGG06_19505 [Thermoanaerobaculia bacterium]|jgi:predicted transcriptional regulator